MGPKWEHRPPPKRVSRSLQKHRYRRAKSTCREKRRFESEREAQLEVLRIKNQRRGFTRPYRCKLCDGWHLTSQKEMKTVNVVLRNLPASLEHRRVKLRELLEEQAEMGFLGLLMPIPRNFQQEIGEKYKVEASWDMNTNVATFDVFEICEPIELDVRPW